MSPTGWQMTTCLKIRCGSLHEAACTRSLQQSAVRQIQPMLQTFVLFSAHCSQQCCWETLPVQPQACRRVLLPEQCGTPADSCTLLVCS